jgi:hypothetical protein
VGQDGVLHLLRADLLAAPVDQVLDPALDHVVAGRRLPEQVAGLAVRHHVPAGVHQVDLVAGGGRAGRTFPAVLREDPRAERT